MKTTGSGHKLNEEDWQIYRSNVYECLFYHSHKWDFQGQSMFFNGSLVHYSDFMKARRGNL